ncbi:TonB-dependent receptor [Mangrovibacterium sp.]|uniref:TonB-dependent receptor n=1 Tax=Mangrovibacterium sp. TaxID=1961364 RepID=UPI00356A65F6
MKKKSIRDAINAGVKCKTWKIMRLSAFFLFLCISQVWAGMSFAQQARLTLKMNNARVIDVLDEIESNSEYYFLFNQKMINVDRKVDVDVNEKLIDDILTGLFAETNVKHQVKDRLIVLTTEKSDNSVETVLQQQKPVSGKITDNTGEPLPGVTVVIKGTSHGTITDLDGKFNLSSIKAEDVLVFSFVGMVTKQIAVGDQTTINVTLLADAIGLEEVVAIGYGTQKKVNLTGAVSSVSANELTTRPVTNISAGLSGMAAGVSVVQNSGGTAGGDGATIRIRGVGTMNNSNPLVVVDGVPSEGTGIMNDIDPNDIESISVLKDAASASIYGSRGANGVILITTKRGSSGKPKLTYNAYFGTQSVPKLIDYVSDFADYMEIANRIRPNQQNFTQADIQEWRANPNDPLYHPNVDWNEELYGGAAPIMNHSLGYSGGNEKTTYRFSLSYLDQDGITHGNNIQRYGLRTNLSSEVLDGVKLGGNVFFRWTNLSPNAINTSIESSPSITNVRHPDGRWGGTQSGSVQAIAAPYAEIENRVREQNDRRLMGDVFAEWEIISGLKATAKVALDFNQGLNSSFNKQYDVWNFRTEQKIAQIELNSGRSATNSQYQDSQVNTNLLLEYNKSIDDHSVKVMGGYETLQYRADNINVTRQQFPNNEVQGINAGLELVSGGGTIAEWSMQSYFGRVNYNYKDKYLFEANIRADGSSRFKKGNRWGYFPSFSAGWNMTEEDFMSDVKGLDYLKLRASWGKLGNNRIGNYPYQSTYALNQNYSFNGQVYSGIAQTALTNEEIKWEETTTTDIGIDGAVLDSRLTFTFDYFVRKTDGILTELPIPQFLGAKTEPVVNLASMENKGFELSLGYRGEIGKVKYNVSANVTQIHNEVTDYFADIVTGGTQIGYPFDSYYGYEVVDIFRTEEQLVNAATHRAYTKLGDLEFKDQLTVDTDGNGIPDAGNGIIGTEDRVIIGNRIPQYTIGGNIGLNYEGFDFSMLFQGVAKRDRNTWDYMITPMNWVDKGVIPQRWVDNEWTPDNPNAILPRMANESQQFIIQESDFWVKDVSYLRVKNMQFGYDLTHSVLKTDVLSKFRVYVSADNLFTFTNEEWGFDPETDNVRSVPNVRTITVGVNVGF